MLRNSAKIIVQSSCTIIRKRLYLNMLVVLSKSDREFASAHGLSCEDMKGFVKDQIIEQENERSFNEEQKRKKREFLDSPQAIYAAW